ncbi:DMT family transporter [candidate division WOR-3 bacterium]|nr:DMT family transporter [candidate division WOR-3 bacterium]
MFFTVASRRLGHNVVNRVRLAVALILLLLAHLISTGTIVPMDVIGYHWLWFGLSGIVGFALGDMLLFKAFVMLGTRLAMLLMALVPVFSTLIAWIFLYELLEMTDILAMSVVIAGIVWVVTGHRNTSPNGKHDTIGILCGIGGAAGQAIGLILSKKGLADGYSALSGNIIRVFTATSVLWVIALIRGRVPYTVRMLQDRPGSRALLAGSICGPFLGVWLSLVAVQNTYVGIASTLMALPPVFLIPLSHWIFKERISLAAIIGTLVAIAGVALIFLL